MKPTYHHEMQTESQPAKSSSLLLQQQLLTTASFILVLRDQFGGPPRHCLPGKSGSGTRLCKSCCWRYSAAFGELLLQQVLNFEVGLCYQHLCLIRYIHAEHCCLDDVVDNFLWFLNVLVRSVLYYLQARCVLDFHRLRIKSQAVHAVIKQVNRDVHRTGNSIHFDSLDVCIIATCRWHLVSGDKVNFLHKLVPSVCWHLLLRNHRC